MSRKRTHRRVVVPLPPRGLRPKLAGDQVTDLALCHLQLLDDISRGRGTEETLWQLVGATLTWSYVAGALQLGVDEMAEQLELATAVVRRYKVSGRIGFSGPEYQAARLGVDVMDQLAERVDRPTAIAAAEWSESRVNRMAAESRAPAAALG